MFKVKPNVLHKANEPPSAVAAPGAEPLGFRQPHQGLLERGRAIAHCPHHSNKVSPRGSTSWDTGTVLNNKQQGRHLVTATLWVPLSKWGGYFEMGILLWICTIWVCPSGQSLKAQK